ncbi:MAG: hypothetical protein AABY22_10265, partial [Nanoarchaeota archaeon]
MPYKDRKRRQEYNKEYLRRYRINNREKILEEGRDYYLKNKETIKKRNQQLRKIPEVKQKLKE